MEALSFVVGALVVGGIALARELMVDRQRWRREERAYDRVTRAARRLVADELDTAQNHMGLMLRRGMWPVPTVLERARFLSNAEWDRHRDRLAEALEDENTWLVLSSFNYSLGQLRARALGEQPGAKLTDEERATLQRMHDQATALQAVLIGNEPLPDDWQAQLARVRAAGILRAAVDEER